MFFNAEKMTNNLEGSSIIFYSQLITKEAFDIKVARIKNTLVLSEFDSLKKFSPNKIRICLINFFIDKFGIRTLFDITPSHYMVWNMGWKI
jgi:hypothetical protein